MTLTSPFPAESRRLPAITLTLILHLVLLYGWHMSSRISVDKDNGAGSRIQWLLAPTPEPVAAPVPRLRISPPVVAAPLRRPAAATPQRDAIAAAPSDLPLEDEHVSPPATSMLERARSAVGAIDRELYAENKTKLIRAKPVSTQMRLERAMQKAHDMAPNKWYQAPKVTEIIDPGGYGRRRYRVVGANGTYCITIESNHAPDGIDTMQHGIKPKLTNCDDDEQAATKQDW
ncbi:hypothetical protein ACFSQU_19470 [Massilia sp. GCM10020059]|uniref:Uncharacterized protein n=1 Tax=Massilia agrisoli TaxID=2892444 RepID=A0ABS8IU73_9BURK|nr:hypothetical protein [Massilia agrisoli]MCC6071723.1 hypothetical protein [Massilia agrisoli]